VALGQTNPTLGPTPIMGGSGTLNSGVTIRYATYAIPGGKWASSYGAGGIVVGVEAIHRFVVDPVSGNYFGYDLSFTGDAAHGYQAVFQELSDAGLTGMGTRSHAIVPKFPPPQSVINGDTIALDLMSNQDGSQKIVDYIQVLLSPIPSPAASSLPAPRDFTVDDAALNFDTSRIEVWIDGVKWSGGRGFTGKPGSTFWIAFPGKGRYILSLVPHEGMVKAGAVRENVLAFEDGGHAYEVRLASPVTGAHTAWNLYMAHDTAYSADEVRSGVDRYENLAVKR
jgi:hypothetical protein